MLLSHVTTPWITDGRYSIRMCGQDLQIRKDKQVFLIIHSDGYYKLFQKEVPEKELKKDFKAICNCFKSYRLYSDSLTLFYFLTKKSTIRETLRWFLRRTLKRFYIKFRRNTIVSEIMEDYKEINAELEAKKDPNA